MRGVIIFAYIFIILFLLYSIYKKEIIALFIRKQEFKCKNCVKCCKLYVELNPKDIKRIKKAGYKEDYFVGTRKKGKVLKIINGYCVFLSVNGGKSKCKIYSHRPNVCRRFPNVKIFSMKSYDPRCDAFKLPKFLP
ncbi:MAG: YkgJ family cysteine cluster protein [Candidatus Woesearchaeota archaeon]|jgi:Fe-S-cluster containining protein|nr:YkgJ family cysteine cluster protein [Candidatus Woesearchaeota archaeon]MDP6265917.1 YkgJ family cysteine cluster protein [Candidatus Woesearchaeota archaeon]MDP7263305.1 YkgJ family cysteine cluster protein [Candidatus Woesearchaeota archaeon]MDP7476366.1 YkgJ family cysteine cluster protein [Candidatus Woesearchaeota archaeon]HJO02049.1 YkgJ family cysteine cluster protein [Candidatus Woesearchaeota archaeon]|tara:strand:- start:180 stop:587 length:408 start_codon:yes stop_codon:yes gene_type:complete